MEISIISNIFTYIDIVLTLFVIPYTYTNRKTRNTSICVLLKFHCEFLPIASLCLSVQFLSIFITAFGSYRKFLSFLCLTLPNDTSCLFAIIRRCVSYNLKLTSIKRFSFCKLLLLMFTSYFSDELRNIKPSYPSFMYLVEQLLTLSVFALTYFSLN